MWSETAQRVWDEFLNASKNRSPIAASDICKTLGLAKSSVANYLKQIHQIGLTDRKRDQTTNEFVYQPNAMVIRNRWLKRPWRTAGD